MKDLMFADRYHEDDYNLNTVYHNSFEEFIPNRLHYHTEVTNELIINRRIGRATEVNYKEHVFLIPTSILVTKNHSIHVHTDIFFDIYNKILNDISRNISKSEILKEVTNLKDQVKILLDKIENIDMDCL